MCAFASRDSDGEYDDDDDQIPEDSAQAPEDAAHAPEDAVQAREAAAQAPEDGAAQALVAVNAANSFFNELFPTEAVTAQVREKRAVLDGGSVRRAVLVSIFVAIDVNTT